VLLAEVAAGRPARDDSIVPILASLKASGAEVPFGMVVDLDSMRIFAAEADDPARAVASFKTAEILNAYDPEFAGKRIFHPYLTTLVVAWLRDMAYHWKSARPPGSEQVARIGLLERLEGGMTEKGDRSWRSSF
jgi:hypothetical protein